MSPLRAADLALQLRLYWWAQGFLLRNPKHPGRKRALALVNKTRKRVTLAIMAEEPRTVSVAFALAGGGRGFAPLLEAMRAREEGRQLGV